MRGPSALDKETGAKTYITQMADVDMDGRKKATPERPLAKARKVKSQSLLEPAVSRPPLPPSMSDAGKLSQLLNAQDP